MEQKAKITKDGLILNGKIYALAPVSPRMMREVVFMAKARAIQEFYKMAVESKIPMGIINGQITHINSNRNLSEIMTSEETAHLLYLRTKESGVLREEIEAIGQSDIVEMENFIFGADPELKLVIQLNPSEKPRLDAMAEKFGVNAPEVCLVALGDVEAWRRAAEVKHQGDGDTPEEEPDVQAGTPAA